MKNRQRQRGNIAIEFAIVFLLFFFVFYAIVTYSLIFVAQQSLTLAAAEGARAALRFQPNAQTVNQSLALRGCVSDREEPVELARRSRHLQRRARAVHLLRPCAAFRSRSVTRTRNGRFCRRCRC